VDSGSFKLRPYNALLADADQATLQDGYIGNRVNSIDNLGLHSGMADCETEGSWNDGGQIEIVQTDPVPLCVTAIVLNVATGG
jgi:hypothetical protein